jgi:hypothetical protein
VPLKRFEEARTERRRRRKHWTDDEMLDGLRQILVTHGRVDADLIDASAFLLLKLTPNASAVSLVPLLPPAYVGHSFRVEP